MPKADRLHKICIFVFLFFVLITGGCAEQSRAPEDNTGIEAQMSQETGQAEERDIEPKIEEVDWSGEFDGINGAAVIYDSTENRYRIYNRELAQTRRSPCSTFKIISSLVALEHGIIEVDDSLRTWSGETFWNAEWNRDMAIADAFQASCVWYFRELVDEIGRSVMQEELNRLSYGNCDISDWEGRLNTNNNNPVLTGFWLESSLLISPKEQAEVVERIFNNNAGYSEEAVNQLKEIMRLPEQNITGVSVYGKTGMGKDCGIVVDAWFTGFAETDGRRISFCVYLGQTDNKNVSSAKAREIAIHLVSEYLN